MQGFSVWLWLLKRYRGLRTAATKAPAQGLGGGWVFLLAFCSCLGFVLVVLSLAGITTTAVLSDAGAAKSIASLFSVSLRAKDAPVE